MLLDSEFRLVEQLLLMIQVMIVDDHRSSRNALAILLSFETDIEVVSVISSGAEVLALCVNLQPDVIVMDVMMPDLNGVQTTRLVRQHCPHTTVVGMTLYGDGQEEAMLDAGAVACLSKDWRLAEKLPIAIRDAAKN